SSALPSTMTSSAFCLSWFCHSYIAPTTPALMAPPCRRARRLRTTIRTRMRMPPAHVTIPATHSAVIDTYSLNSSRDELTPGLARTLTGAGAGPPRPRPARRSASGRNGRSPRPARRCGGPQGRRGVLALDLVQQRRRPGLDAGDVAEQPEEQVDRVDPLVHQRAPAVEGPPPAPARQPVVVGGPVPGHAGRDAQHAPQAARLG